MSCVPSFLSFTSHQAPGRNSYTRLHFPQAANTRQLYLHKSASIPTAISVQLLRENPDNLPTAKSHQEFKDYAILVASNTKGSLIP